MQTFYEQWFFARPALARRHLDHLLEGSGDPIALVGERRIGKTTYLLNDLMPAAQDRGLATVYVDLWQNQADPLGAINYALQEAIDDANVPAATVLQRAKTPIKKIGGAGFSMEFGEDKSRTRPSDPALLLDWLLRTLVRTVKKPVLLMFDEIQEVTRAANSERIVAALRATLTKNKRHARALFTGSSQDELAQLFLRTRAPLYEGASVESFPLLGQDFLKFVITRAEKRLSRKFTLEDAKSAFERLQFRPRLFIDALLLAASRGDKQLRPIADEIIAQKSDNPQYAIDWQALKPLYQGVLRRIALGVEVSSDEARREYAAADPGKDANPVSPGSVDTALRSLIKKRVVNKLSGERGRYEIDDVGFAEWIRSRANVPLRAVAKLVMPNVKVATRSGA
jgi:uncharacterized protein